MSRSVNKAIILGHAGKDPEVKYLPNGTAVANFSVALNERRKKGDEWEDFTEWVNMVSFGKTAEVVGEYVKKGKQVYVEGKLRTTSWDDKDSGKKRYKTEVVVDQLVLLGGSDRKSAYSADEKPAGETITDEDLPF